VDRSTQRGTGRQDRKASTIIAIDPIRVRGEKLESRRDYRPDPTAETNLIQPRDLTNGPNNRLVRRTQIQRSS
jgi:hypothetical protein